MTNGDNSRFWPHRWWTLMEMRVGIIPLPIYFGLLVVIAYFVHLGKVPTDICMMGAVIAVGAFSCAALGERIPLLRRIGGAAILCTVVPSIVAYYHLLPEVLVRPVVDFTKYTVFLYLYISCLIVGSILGMDRTVLIKCFLKIFVPISIGTIMAALAGVAVAGAFGLDLHHAFFFVVVPIMAGGVGEGAIPLSIGYAQLLHVTQEETYAQVLPPVIVGSLIAMLFSGLLNIVGKKYPRLTGEGRLQPDEHDDVDLQHSEFKGQPDLANIAAAILFAVALYLFGLLGNEILGLPAPVGMVFLALTVKLTRAVSPKFQEGSYFGYRFCAVALTYPVIFTNSLAITPWDKLIAACSLPNLLTIIATVSAMTATGFIVARWIGMYPVDLAIVTACRCSKGGSGDVAILDTANRMQLMPFAQTATRIGGAITVTLAVIAMSRFP
jgi:malate:Na+ symporter